MERRKLTLMFTDIVGYSRLMGQNESQTIQLVEHYRRILLESIERHQGTLIEFIGDAVFASFVESNAAVTAAIEIQQVLQQFNEQQTQSQQESDIPALRTRIGLHTGEVTLKEGSPFGDDVNIAARLEPLAVADGICISQAVYNEVKEHLNIDVKALGKQTLKNIDNKINVYLIRPSGITLNTHAHYAWKETQFQINKHRYTLATLLLCLIVAGFYFIPRWLVPGYTANYVEIADFKNLTSEGGEADYFSAGITEALRSQLADMEDVYIVDPDDGVRGPVRLEGSVQRAGDNLRIAYRLFRRKDNVQIAGGKLDGVYDDIFILQDRVVAEVGRYIAQEFDLRFFRPAALELTSDVTAYEYYLKGKEYLGRPESQENYDKAINQFSTALVHDPSFSKAMIGICSAYRGKYNLTKTVSFIEKAEGYCAGALDEKFVDLDALVALALVKFYKGDLDKSILYLQKAIAAHPEDVNVLSILASVYAADDRLDIAEKTFEKTLQLDEENWRVYVDYSHFLIGVGKLEQSIALLKRGLKVTEENIQALNNLGASYLYIGKFESAAEIFSKAADISPSADAYANAGNSYYFSGDFGKSLDYILKAIKLSPDDFRYYVGAADVLRYIPERKKEVEKYARMAIKLIKNHESFNDSSAALYQYSAIAFHHVGEKEMSLNSLNKAMSLKPKDLEVLLTAIRLWTLWGEHEKAVNLIHVFLQIGYPNFLLLADPDLYPLRDVEGFFESVN